MTIFGFSDYFNIHKQNILQAHSELNKGAQHSDHSTSLSNDSQLNQRSTLFENRLKDIFWVEKELAKVLPRVIKKSENTHLENLLKIYQKDVKEHIYELQSIFEFIDIKLSGKKSVQVYQILKNLEYLTSISTPGQELDEEIISAISKIQQYKMSTYATLHQFTHKLGSSKNTDILEKIIGDEKTIEFKLTKNKTSI